MVEQLREEIARSGLKLYRVAASVGVHPNVLGRILRGKAPLAPEIEGRLRSLLASRGQS